MGAATSSAWRGRLVMFLALFLVPVVIVATPSVAAAAETITRGPSVSATVDGFSLFSAVPGNDQTCTLTAQWVTPAAESILTPPFVQVGGISCSQGNAFDNIGGAPGSSMTVELQGEGCGGSSVLPISYANGFDPSQATFPGGPVAVDSGCSIGEVCLTYETHGGGLAAWFSHTYDTTCAALGLGLPPESGVSMGTECPSGNPSSAPSWTWYDAPGSDDGVRVRIRGDFRTGSPLRTFNAAVAFKPSDAVGWQTANDSGGWPQHVPLVLQADGTYLADIRFYQTLTPTYRDAPRITGIQIYRTSVYNNEPVVPVPAGPSPSVGWGAGGNLFNDFMHGGQLGVTAPASCGWWFGPKVGELASTTVDEPFAPLAPGMSDVPPDPPSGEPEVEAPTPPPADPTSDACGDGFSFFKPATWAGATTCAVVAALKAIWEVLQSVGGAIANLPGRIADAFGALFVPESGFVADKVDNVKSRWDDTAPVVLVDEVAGLGDTFSMGSPGGCAGPPLNIDTEFTGSLSLNPLSACGPQVSVVANIVKIALTVIVYVGAGLGALRLLGSALGLDLSIDKSGE